MSKLLHFANIPDDFTVDLLREKASSLVPDCILEASKIFSVSANSDGERKMMLAEFSTLEHAIMLLCHLHGTELGGRRLLVSFAKSSLAKD